MFFKRILLSGLFVLLGTSSFNAFAADNLDVKDNAFRSGNNQEVALSSTDTGNTTSSGAQIHTPNIAIMDGSRGPAEIDGTTNALTEIMYSHHKIHEGKTFMMHNGATIGGAEVNTISLKTPNSTTIIHMVATFTASGTANIDILEDVTSVTGGAEEIPFNHNRNSSIVSTVTAPLVGDAQGADPILPTGGTLIVDGQIGTAIKSGGDRELFEIMLKTNSIYLFRIISVGAGNVTQINLDSYEHVSEN